MRTFAYVSIDYKLCECTDTCTNIRNVAEQETSTADRNKLFNCLTKEIGKRPKPDKSNY